MGYYDADPFFYTGEEEREVCYECADLFIKQDKHGRLCPTCEAKELEGEGENE